MKLQRIKITQNITNQKIEDTLKQYYLRKVDTKTE